MASKKIKLSIFAKIFLSFVLFIGLMACAFVIINEATDVNITVNDNALEVIKLGLSNKFKCNPYNEPYYSCAAKLKFINSTGLYCDGRLVCQND